MFGRGLNFTSIQKNSRHDKTRVARQQDASLAGIHRESMVNELESLQREEELLEKKLKSVASIAEKQTIQAEIDLVKLRIKRFEYRIDRFDRDQGN